MLTCILGGHLFPVLLRHIWCIAHCMHCRKRHMCICYKLIPLSRIVQVLEVYVYREAMTGNAKLQIVRRLRHCRPAYLQFEWNVIPGKSVFWWRFPHEVSRGRGWISSSVTLTVDKVQSLAAWLSGRAPVFDRRTYPIPRSTCSWWVTTYVGKPSPIRSAS